MGGWVESTIGADGGPGSFDETARTTINDRTTNANQHYQVTPRRVHFVSCTSVIGSGLPWLQLRNKNTRQVAEGGRLGRFSGKNESFVSW